jgi:hypothetical protein
VSGRQSKPKSHWWYVVSDPPAKAMDKYTDLDGTDLLELRSTGGQTICPPGTHESGEALVWYTFTQPATVVFADLLIAVRKLAAAALVARHWPSEGKRQDAALALAGGLARESWTPEEVANFIRAVATAAGDDEVEMRCNTAERSKQRIEEGKYAWGWPKLGEFLMPRGDEVVGKVRQWSCARPRAQVAELPLTETRPWPAPPGEEAFHGLAGRIVRTIEPVSEADPAALLVQVLLAFGNAIGRNPHFIVEGDRHRGNEFAVLVGKTSKARKGTSWGRIYGLMEQAEAQWAAERVQTGLSSGEGLIWAVRDAIKKRERVKERGEPVRFEEVEADPGIEDKRLMVYEPEFANCLKQTERQGNTLSATLRVAWDSHNLRSMTKNSPARATGAHVSLVGHITAEELRRYLTQTETANGFANRHLWVCADRSKFLPEGGRIDPDEWAVLCLEMVEALAFARTAGEMSRDNEARALWCDVYNDLSEGKPGLAGALLARGEAHVMRLALQYALLDRSTSIQSVHLLAALTLWDYCERSVRYVFGDDLGDPIADELLRLLRGCKDGLTRNDMRNYFGRHQSSDRIGHALGVLLQHRLARRERQETTGRPAERWFAVVKGQ